MDRVTASRIRFEHTSTLATGRSKLGGEPDLPDGWTFPTNEDGDEIPFLCQLNLSEFDNGIAPTGMLYFFCQLDDTTEFGAVLFCEESCSLSPTTPGTINREYMEIDYPLPVCSIAFERMEELALGAPDYYEIMGASRFGGAPLSAGADHETSGRISLLQLNTSELEELEDEVEQFLHFFIDEAALEQKNFADVFVTSQH